MILQLHFKQTVWENVLKFRNESSQICEKGGQKPHPSFFANVDTEGKNLLVYRKNQLEGWRPNFYSATTARRTENVHKLDRKISSWLAPSYFRRHERRDGTQCLDELRLLWIEYHRYHMLSYTIISQLSCAHESLLCVGETSSAPMWMEPRRNWTCWYMSLNQRYPGNSVSRAPLSNSRSKPEG